MNFAFADMTYTDIAIDGRDGAIALYAPVPVPPAVLLLGPAVIALLRVRRRKTSARTWHHARR